ncbi:DNA cytosine methyltransferase [Endozoicomonas gorgoniicola]|uniref:DNA (cytosine-5-)-methyltransferase n=1 Tax=Endozoicomonas gorgoniicola TaxID=1234144 RepID=A0ABT3N487_9GAMM|nr:DNA cytosine methyltransferase [Endozoicomonas gorgoniicola]MCW7556447.1 DNA cytosine methyltransferase [Endozoicomonas gorgoniicola]MCW7556532.1 DNA cytosine methyltransferase [Endozoicomonas gorgoniicola]
MEKENKKYRINPQMGLNFSGELIVDNFAGGGGASTGIEMALGRPVDIAINHDPEAIAMHTINHPHTKHYCESVWKVDPVKACNGRPVGLAWFSPDCTHHSKARGGKPKSKKIRGLAWVAVRWAKRVKPRVIILENVEEFQDWGPLLENNQPCPIRKGETFKEFVQKLNSLGYKVEWKELRACDYGAPTIRKRLFLIARCDGQPIVWPVATHGPGTHQPYRSAAECIDWSIPSQSIFERARPLADNTLRRIAKGIQKFVVNDPKPFIVPIAHYNGRDLVHDIEQPIRTITASPKGGAFSLVTAFIAKHYTGVTGSSIKESLHTITTADHNALVTAQLEKRNNHSEKVHAFLVKYYGSGDNAVSLREPIHTITTRERFGLVTVKGELYQIVDIAMRMLSPRELYNANGFTVDYIIDRDASGKRLSKKSQVARCGNAVPPQFSEALVKANVLAIETSEVA